MKRQSARLVRAVVSAGALQAMLAGSGCVAARIDRPSAVAVDGGASAGVRFSSGSTRIEAPGFEQDAATEQYVVNALNRAVDGTRDDAEARTALSLAPAATDAPPLLAGDYDVTLVTQTPEGQVKTTERGAVGSSVLRGVTVGSAAVGSLSAAIGTALLPLNIGLAPTCGLLACGVCGLGVSLGTQVVATRLDETDASDLVARAINAHGDALRSRRRGARAEIAPKLEPVASPPVAAPPVAAPPPAKAPMTTTAPAAPELSGEWFYSVDGARRVGPVSADALEVLIDSGTVTGATLVWQQGMKDWRPADKVDATRKRLRAKAASTPPPLPKGERAPAPTQEQPKRRIVDVPVDELPEDD